MEEDICLEMDLIFLVLILHQELISDLIRNQPIPNNTFFCDYCNWKGHVKATCYKLNGYLADWKGISTGTGQYLHHQHSFYGSSSGSTSDSNPSTPMISYDQENIKKHNDTAMQTTCMMHSSTMHTDDDKWIINSGASKHMVHNLGMLTQHTSLDASPNHMVHLLTGSSAHVNNIGSSQVLGGTKISNDLSNRIVGGPGRLENDLYVVQADCQLKSQGAQLKSPKTQVHVVNASSSTMSCNFWIKFG
ncbi:hypothetical protein H5410_062800 [Solanum commersonii]|uniref:Uncharacterized protein n=1 Tax=Solanum commersonii TaxID=4109 RepID=A0A9J5WBT0_SOLCO|nr:hypothetical protein H5410_062800 [Solanum commersonii]